MSLAQLIKDGDWVSVRQAIAKLSTQALGPNSTPTFAGLTLTGLDASEFVFTDANKTLSSVNVPLVVAYGGSGAVTFTDHSILLGSGTDAFTALGVATNGQLPIGSTGADPVLAGLTGNANQIIVTNGTGSITLSTPQDIHTAAAPTFASLTLNGTATYGIDLSAGTWSNGVMNWDTNPDVYVAGARFIHADDTNYNMFWGTGTALGLPGGITQAQADGQYNVFQGYQAGYNNDSSGGGSAGLNNVYIGYKSGYGTTGANSGYQNVAVGPLTLLYNTLGYQNFALGYGALRNNTSGYRNVAIGHDSLVNNQTGNRNMAIGDNSLYRNTGSSNVGIGYLTGYNQTLGLGNIFIGDGAGNGGASARYDQNVGIGYRSLYSLIANGNTNLAIGYNSGYSISSGALNVLLGPYAGYRQTTASNLLIIDNQDRGSTANEATNSLLYGLFDATPANQYLKINGNLYLSLDNRKIYLGTGNDAEIYYDGTNLVLSPRVVGTGGVTIGVGSDGVDYKLIFDGYDNDGTLTWMEDEAVFQFDNYLRTSTSIYRRYYHLPIAGFDPGAAGATWTSADANHLSGWQLNAAGETLEFNSDVHSDWDGASDLTVEVRFQLLDAGSNEDTVDLKLVCYYMGNGDTATKTQTQEVATVTDGTQYKMYTATFTINYDETDNVVDAEDEMSFILNLETDTSEIDNVLITGASFFYQTTHTGIESTDT